MNQPDKTRAETIASVAAGLLIACIAALFTFGIAIAVLSKMSWAAVFFFFPSFGIATLVWAGIVVGANRGNGPMWFGTLIFAVLAIIGLAYYLNASKRAHVAKLEATKRAHIELGESLATSRTIENPTGPLDRVGFSGSLCQTTMCAHALLFGMAKEVVMISDYGISYYRLQPIEKCPTGNDSLAAFVEHLQRLGMFDACLRRMKRVQSDPNSEIQNAVLIDYRTRRDRVLEAVARRLDDGRVTGELARWEYFSSYQAARSFGDRFTPVEFLEAFTGMTADTDRMFVRRSFSEAVQHIKERVGRIKMNEVAISSYLGRLLEDTRKNTGRPVIVERTTNEELQFIYDQFCFGKTAENSACASRLRSLRREHYMEIRP